MNPATLPLEDAEPVLGKGIEREYALADLLRRPNVTYETLVGMQGGKYALESPLAEDPLLAEQIREQVEIGIKYHGYIARQADEVERLGANENTRLPADFDYSQVRGLSIEVQQKLAKHKPETIGQASRISGITPAAVSLLLVHLKKGVLRGQVGPRATSEGEAA